MDGDKLSGNLNFYGIHRDLKRLQNENRSPSNQIQVMQVGLVLCLISPCGSALGYHHLFLGKKNLSNLVTGEMPTAQQTRSSK